MGLTLPATPEPSANYVSYKKVGDLSFSSPAKTRAIRMGASPRGKAKRVGFDIEGTGGSRLALGYGQPRYRRHQSQTTEMCAAAGLNRGRPRPR